MSFFFKKTNIINILIISAFLPYLSLNIPVRLELLVIYTVGLITVFGFTIHWKIPRNGIYLSSILLLLLLLSLVSLIFIEEKNLQMLQDRSTFYVLADLERLIRVVFIIIIVSSILNNIKPSDFDHIKTKCINLFLILLSLNTLLIIYVLISKDLPQFILDLYWNTDRAFLSDTVAGRSYLNGRYTGIFIQPMESGFAYGLGFILLLYKNKFNFFFSIRNLIILFFIIFGGILSISKIFFIGISFITIVIIFLKYKNIFKNIISLSLFFPLVFILLNFLPLENWSGIQNYSIVFTMISSLEMTQIIDALSAGRFANPESAVTQMVKQVLTFSPYFGFGAGSFAANEVPVDSGYMLFYYQTGTVGFLIFSLSILFLLINQSARLFVSPSDESRLLYLLIVFVIGTSIGSPVLFLNRSGTILWIFIMIFLIRESKKKNLENEKR